MSRLEELIQELCPDGVEYKPLEQCCSILDNKRKPVTKGSRVSGEYPYYGANGIQDYVSDYIFDGTFVLVGEDGSVITPNGNPVVTWAEGKIWVNNHAHVMRFKSMAMQKMIEQYLNVISLQDYITGTAQPKLNQEKLNGIPIPCVPENLQEQFATFVRQTDKSKFELTQALEALNATYKKLISENLG